MYRGSENTGEYTYKTIKVNVDRILNDLASNRNVNILHRLTYPKDRSVDHVLEYKNCKTLLKFSNNVSSRSKLYQELKKLSKELKVNSLIVTNKFNDNDIVHDVLYIRGFIGIISTQTIQRYAKGDKVFVYEYNGMLYVKINGAKLKRLRENKGYRIHELANVIGISAKTLKSYENGKMDMTIEKAYRFLEVLGNEFSDAIEEVDIFRDRILQKDVESHVYVRNIVVDKRYKIIDKLKSYGLEVNIYNFIPSDIITGNENTRFFISYIERNLNEEEAKTKCKNNYFFALTFKGKPIVVADDDVNQKTLTTVESYGHVSKVSNIEELAKEIVEDIKR